MFMYFAQGEVYPNVINMETELWRFKVYSDDVNAEVGFCITKENVICAAFNADRKIDPNEVLGRLEQVVQKVLNAIAFKSGLCGSAFIHTTALVNSGGPLHSISMSPQQVRKDGFPENFIHQAFYLVAAISGDQSGWHLTCALDEFRWALRLAHDTGFRCYRTIECLRNYCKERFHMDAKNENLQWAKLRELTGKTKDEIMAIKSFADSPRHGNFEGISGPDRVKIVNATSDILDAFFAALQRLEDDAAGTAAP